MTPDERGKATITLGPPQEPKRSADDYWSMTGSASLEMKAETVAAIPAPFRVDGFLLPVTVGKEKAAFDLEVAEDFTLGKLCALAEMFWTKDVTLEKCSWGYGDHCDGSLTMVVDLASLHEWFHSPPETQQRQAQRGMDRREQQRQHRIAEARRVLAQEGE